MFPIKDTVRSRTTPIVNLSIIGANILIFVYLRTLGAAGFREALTTYGAVPQRLVQDFSLAEVGTIFSSMFLHGDWFHIIANMWGLFIFGDNVEDRLGHFRYLAFYLIGGVGAAAAHIAIAPDSALPMVGASGAISAVMGGYIVMFPRSRVLTLIPIFFIPWLIQVPALIYIGVWFVSQLFSGLFSLAADPAGAQGGVAWWAHIGGFVLGVLLVRIFVKRVRYREFRADEYWPW